VGAIDRGVCVIVGSMVCPVGACGVAVLAGAGPVGPTVVGSDGGVRVSVGSEGPIVGGVCPIEGGNVGNVCVIVSGVGAIDWGVCVIVSGVCVRGVCVTGVRVTSESVSGVRVGSVAGVNICACAPGCAVSAA
jgi:hypothetical protein